MAINLLELEPSVIDRSLSGKSLLLAGPPKIGKSEFCAQSPDTFILDFENGYNFHPGVIKYTITKWTQVKEVLRELGRPEVQAKFKNVVFDTLNEAWELATAYICNQHGVQKIGDIPYGAGYKERDKEVEKTLRTIITYGYGLIVTCHTKESVIGTKDDIDIKAIAPDLDKRCVPIINGLVDVMGMISAEWNENGESIRWLYTQATPTISAGNRIGNLPKKIPFGYDHLQDAISKAIDESEKDGAKVVDRVEKAMEKEMTYEEIRAEASELWGKLVEKDEENAARIMKKVEIIFGHSIKLSEIMEDQKDLFYLVLLEMRDML